LARVALRRFVSDDPIQPAAEVPSRLEDLILSMLAKTPAHRPDDAGEIAQRLTEIQRRAQDEAFAERSYLPLLRLLSAG
jgi:hypothetical protein